MDKDQLLELLPHYLAMLLLVFATLFVLESVAGDLSFWIELVIVAAIVFAYRPAVIYLGVAPSSWERSS